MTILIFVFYTSSFLPNSHFQFGCLKATITPPSICISMSWYVFFIIQKSTLTTKCKITEITTVAIITKTKISTTRSVMFFYIDKPWREILHLYLFKHLSQQHPSIYRIMFMNNVMSLIVNWLQWGKKLFVQF